MTAYTGQNIRPSDLDIETIAHHRNGVTGEAFHVVLFRYRQNATWRPMVATVWPGRVAVLDRELLAAGDVAFGSNSWRGDQFEPALQMYLAEWERNQ